MHHRSKALWITTSVLFWMGLSVFIRPQATISVFTYIETRLGIHVQTFAVLSMIAAVVLIGIVPRIKRPRVRLALELLCAFPLPLYAAAAGFYVALNDVNPTVLAWYVGLIVAVYLLGVGHGSNTTH